MNYFEDYYSPDDQREPENYIEPRKPKQRKERKGLKRLISILLVLALMAGSCGVTAIAMNRYWQKEMELVFQRMDDKISAAHKQVTTLPAEEAPATTSKPVSAGMTPGEVYNQNVNAVVAITVEVTAQDIYGRTSSGYSAGTGFFITSDGYIVTNHHVVDGGTKVTITTHNDEEYEAKIIGYEKNNDLALLKVDAENFPHVTIGKSSELQVGDQVVAIGNVLSTFASSLTVGYVSGVDRVVDTEGVAMNMIQTDAAINSGNSGGPLFNMKGEVIGITSAKFSGNSSSGASIEGIGLAIPMDDVVGMIEDLKTYGYVTGAYLGVMIVDVDTAAQYYGLPAGAYVDSVTAGSAAEKGGILAKDIITEIGGYAVSSVSDVTRVLRKFSAGQTVTVDVYRSGQHKTLSVTLDEKPREETQPKTQTPNDSQSIPGMPEGGTFEDFYNFFQNPWG